jgi:hypothetical protein
MMQNQSTNLVEEGSILDDMEIEEVEEAAASGMLLGD